MAQRSRYDANASSLILSPHTTNFTATNCSSTHYSSIPSRSINISASPFRISDTWTPDSDSAYFFNTHDRDNNILSDFGWIFNPDASKPDDGFPCLEPIAAAADTSDLAGTTSSGPLVLDNNSSSSSTAFGSPDPAPVVGSASTTPSVSTSSSEDPPERSTGSGGKPPSEIPSKVKMKGPKRIRQPRFAFMTKSEVDNLEDGYRWRKYVKKRVERSSQDPTTAIITCEGQHCHHTVAFPRGGVMGHEFGFMGHQLSQLPPASQFMYYPTIRPREITNPINLTPTLSHQVHGLVVTGVDEVEDDAVRRQKIKQATSWSFRDAGLGDEEELASARRLSCAGVEEKDMAGN
ncbi:hypothetical protein FF1_006822 [Malus domestica]